MGFHAGPGPHSASTLFTIGNCAIKLTYLGLQVSASSGDILWQQGIDYSECILPFSIWVSDIGGGLFISWQILHYVNVVLPHYICSTCTYLGDAVDLQWMGYFTFHQGGEEQKGCQQSTHCVAPETEEMPAVYPIMGQPTTGVM